MDFGTAIRTVLSKYATFDGRARRSEYWYFYLLNFLLGFGYRILAACVGRDSEMIGLISLLYLAVSLGLLIPGLAVAVRRLHDIGKSGGYIFIGLIPIVGWILLLIWYVQDSQPGENQYGPNPKGISLDY